jgi:hypothetical protein
MRRLAVVALLLLLAATARGEDAQLDAATGALRGDRSGKVRAQAAIVLGQRGGPEAIGPLAEALERDGEPAVRLAVIGALSRVGGERAREALEAAARSDPDARVRDSAAKAVAAFAPNVLAFSIEETSGQAGGSSVRAALRDAIARQLRDRGYSVVERGAGYRLKPSLLSVDVEEGGGGTIIAVKASLVAVDGHGRMAAMLEGGARLKATGRIPGGDLPRYSAKAVEAAARTLCEDLAARLQ